MSTLWKALAADLKSSPGWGNGFGPWVKDEWYEVEGPVVGTDPDGISDRLHNGFHCSDDVIHCQYPLPVEYLAQVEVDGDSVIYRKDQCWQKMRVISVKAWPASKTTLTLDWAEGQCHNNWAVSFPSQAAVYDSKHYQGQYADMLEIIVPLWKSLFVDGDTIVDFKPDRNRHRLFPWCAVGMERMIRLAVMLARCLTGNLTLLGAASCARLASSINPAAWDVVRGNVEGHWATLPEL